MFLDLGQQPMANNFLNPEQFETEPFYHLECYFCPECLTVQIGECPDSEEVFNENYSFFTGTSARMVEHFADLAGLIKERYLPADGLIVEIGSNDGTFLRHFKDYRHLGFDPSGASDAAKAKGLNIAPRPFGAINGNVNVIVSANTFAHIPDRAGVLGNIKHALYPDGVWINEEPYLGNTINQLAYDQFYNEHVFYSSIASMRNALLMHDLDILDLEFIWTHGGSIRYFVGHRNAVMPAKIAGLIENEGLDTFEVFERFGQAARKHTERFKAIVEKKKPLPGYAATAKSTTVLNFCKLGPGAIPKIYDTTPAKQGKYSPGMHIPIVPAEQFKADDSPDVVLFAWNHAWEITSREAGAGRRWLLPISEAML